MSSKQILVCDKCGVWYEEIVLEVNTQEGSVYKYEVPPMRDNGAFRVDFCANCLRDMLEVYLKKEK